MFLNFLGTCWSDSLGSLLHAWAYLMLLTSSWYSWFVHSHILHIDARDTSLMPAMHVVLQVTKLTKWSGGFSWVQSFVNLRPVSACKAFKLWKSRRLSTPKKVSFCSFVVKRCSYFSRLPLTERLVSVVIVDSLQSSGSVPAMLLRSSCLKEGQSLTISSACKLDVQLSLDSYIKPSSAVCKFASGRNHQAILQIIIYYIYTRSGYASLRFWLLQTDEQHYASKSGFVQWGCILG